MALRVDRARWGWFRVFRLAQKWASGRGWLRVGSEWVDEWVKAGCRLRLGWGGFEVGLWWLG